MIMCFKLGLGKTEIAGLHPMYFDSQSQEQSMKICISLKLPGGAAAPGSSIFGVTLVRQVLRVPFLSSTPSPLQAHSMQQRYQGRTE